MKIQHLGHAGFILEDLLIDPFVTGNPICPIKCEEVKCQIICVTHDHPDHLGDTVKIAKQNNATVVAIYELAEKIGAEGVNVVTMNMGGTVTVGDWKIKMVEAKHSCVLGAPAGFVLENTRLNKKIYHAGDTALFSDMRLIGEMGIDIAFLPIGDHFTMGIKDAAQAVDLIKPKLAVPMHYNTFPMIMADPAEFKTSVSVLVEIFAVGEIKEL